jgi:Tfp pilus assembly protein PilO
MNKMRQWSMLTGVAVLAVFAAGWFLAVSPQRHHATSLRTEVVSQQASNAQLLSQINQLKQQKQGLPAQQRLLDQIAAKVPDNPALPTLIRELSTAANSAGVDLQSMAPALPTQVVAGAPVAATTTATTGSAAATSLQQISVVIKVQGSYFNVESFFAAVEKMKRAMRITQFSMTPGAAASSSSSGSTAGAASSGAQLAPDTLDASLTGLVYESPEVVPSSPVAPATVSK